MKTKPTVIKKVENEYGVWEITTEETEQGQILTLKRSEYWSFDERKTK